LLLALQLGCGVAAGPSYAPPYVTFSGVVTSASIETPSEVRVALAWKRRDPEGNLLRVAQELAVRAEFPARFQLDVTSLPPEEAMNLRKLPDGSGDPAFRYSTGTLLVYQDGNGNGTLDLLPIDAQSTIDRVLGAPARLSVFYLERTPPAEGGSGALPGFNLRLEAPQADPAPGASPCASTSLGPQQYLPLGTEIEVALTGAPELSRQVCERSPPAQNVECVGDACPAPAPGAEVTCSADGAAFVAKLCQPAGSLCGSVWCDFTCGRRSLAEPLPAAWPCR
jgi:hypothetical protein